MPEIGARRATRADLDAVVAITALAFANDPLWSTSMAIEGGTTEHHARFWRVFIEGALRYPWVWLTGGDEATAIWIPPSGTEMSEEQEEQITELAAEILGPSADAYLELLALFEAAHPRDRAHYYLSLLGTHPDHRGKGIGMALLEQNLGLIDAEGLPAYLESSNPANNHRYASVGFEQVGEFAFPGGGPIVTTMWRSPR